MELNSQTLSPITSQKDIELTATIPLEMINAQQQLITWCDGKLNVLRFESTELGQAAEHAKKMKWKSGTLQGQYDRSLKRITYYEKIKEALLEGYYIVPNFPIQMFAIRTSRKKPLGTSGSYWHDHTQDAQELKIMVGEYQNPVPLVIRNKKVIEGKEVTYSSASDWDNFEFPITMARPKIMEATSHAMDLKIFDQIGVMPKTRKEDPVIMGQIFHKEGYHKKTVSFMIAWHLNTNVL